MGHSEGEEACLSTVPSRKIKLVLTGISSNLCNTGYNEANQESSFEKCTRRGNLSP